MRQTGEFDCELFAEALGRGEDGSDVVNSRTKWAGKGLAKQGFLAGRRIVRRARAIVLFIIGQDDGNETKYL